MAKIIEASAIISGKAGDMSGFAAIARQLESVSKAGDAVKKAMTGAVGDIGKKVEEAATKLRQIDNFRSMSKGLDAASVSMKRAVDEAARLKSAIDAADKPTRAMRSEYERAALAVSRATEAFRTQGQAVRAARSDLAASGIPINQLRAQQAQLTAAINSTTQAMQRQAAAGRSIANPWGSIPRSGSGVPLISRAAPNGVVPPHTPTMNTSRFPIGGAAAGIGGAMAGRSAYERAIEFERSVNASQARGELSAEEAQALRRNARAQGAAGRGFSARDVSELQRAYVQAGAEKQAAELAGSTMDFARFGDVDPFEAADVSVSGVAAFGIMPGDPRFPAAVRRYQDVVAKGANISRLSVGDLAQGFKYAAPLAHRLGLSQEQLAAMIVTQGQAGLRGDEAGVAVRSALVRAVRPTADARQVMAEMGMRWEDFQTGRKPVDFSDYAAGLRAQGFNIEAKRGAIEGRVNSAVEAGGDPATAIAEAVIAEMGVSKVIDRRKIAKMTARYASSLGEGLDIDRLLSALQARGVTAGQIARIFDAKQGARLSTLIGPDYERYRAVLENESAGASARGAVALNQGAVGAHNRLVSSYDNLVLSLAESGVLDSASKALDTVASGLRNLAETSPRLLEIGTYGALAAAALGPLSFAIGRLAGAAGAVGSALGLPAAASAVAGSALPRIAGMAGIYGAAGYLAYEGVKAISEGNARLYQNIAPGEVHNQGQNRRKAFHDALYRETQQLRLTVEGGAKPEKQDVSVSGNTKVEVVITPSASFQGLVNGATAAANAPLSSNGPGSNGRSQPEASAPTGSSSTP